MSLSDDAAKRAFWAQQMDLGYKLIEDVTPFEVRECGEGFASLRDEAEKAGVEMLFSTSKIAGELERVLFIREGLAKRVMDVGRDMNNRGWILKIEDGYRSLEMQAQLGRKPALFDVILNKCIWECGGEIPSVELVSRRANVLISNLPKVGTHMSGSAIDVSVFRRDDGTEVWRGNPYLEMSERTPMRSPFVEPEFIQNRLEITSMLEAHGFVHFPYEFWHFNQGDGLGNVLAEIKEPARYGAVHWDPKTNRVTPVDNPTELLTPLPEIQRQIEAAFERAKQRREENA